MKKRLLAIILIIALLCPVLLTSVYADTSVYITDTGKKYHNAGCRSLSKSCHEISLSQAIKKGYTACSVCGADKLSKKPDKSTGPFVDVLNDAFYYKPVSWAYYHDPQITSGMDKTHFCPDLTCTRAQIVTFLWRANGCPAPKATKCSFKDVKSGEYYYKAVLWAAENKITDGMDKTHFAPDSGCTRAQVVTFLWRADKKPAASGKCPFKDVKSGVYYYKAVLWAVENEITSGMTPNKFEPDTSCARSQIVTFLYRYAQNKAVPSNSEFEIYFIDVGQGDAALVRCDGKAMLIDGGNNSESSLIYSFLKSHGVKHLDYIIASHPDADHVGGLSGALNYATVDKAFCTVKQHDTETFKDFVKYLSLQDVKITVPDAGDKYSLGSASFTVLYPEKGSVITNNSSLIIRIEYGKTSFLFTGDAETDDENTLLDAGYTVKSTVLKVGHHGSNSSTSYRFIYNVEPEYAVISVGGDNSYGHPTDNVLSRLHDADVVTFRTDMQGDIHCVSDGKTVKFDVEKNAGIDTFSFPGGYTKH